MIKKNLGLILLLISLHALLGCSQAPPPAVDGLRKSFYQDGQIESEKTYVNGTLSGPTQSYYINGQIAWKGNFLNGKLDGPASFFYNTGVIQANRNYVDGTQTGQTKIFSSTGTLMAVFNIEKGRKQGEAIYFYQNGVPLKKETYVHGIKEGSETLFSRDGQIKSTRMFRNGVLIGGSPNEDRDPADSEPSAQFNEPLHEEMTKAAQNTAQIARPASAQKISYASRKIPSREELLQAVARSNPQLATGDPASKEKSRQAAPLDIQAPQQ